MALPHRRQQLAKFIKVHDLTYKKVAEALQTDAVRINNMVQGKLYPTPAECDALEALFGLPAELMLEPSMLAWRHNWPPRYGSGS